MTRKHRAHDEEAWKSAKKICRLSARQVEMARELGMNPNKLPKLRPSPHQRWKLPVGQAIEQLHRERFAATDGGPEGWWEPPLDSFEPPAPGGDMPRRVVPRDPASQASSLICYLANLADDLRRWLSHGEIDPEVLPQVRDELRAIANALDSGDGIREIPEIPIPPAKLRASSKRPVPPRRAPHPLDVADDFDDDVPF
jgi:hypothetical protein